MRIEWSTTVFRDHLLNFEKSVDFYDYKTSLVFKIHKSSVLQHILLRRPIFLQESTALSLFISMRSPYAIIGPFPLDLVFRVSKIRVIPSHSTVDSEAVVATSGKRGFPTNRR